MSTMAITKHSGDGSIRSDRNHSVQLFSDNPVASEGPSHPGYFEPKLAKVDATKTNHAKNHLLGAPVEIINKILEVIRTDIDSNSGQVLAVNPTTGYEGVPLICRQLYHETVRGWLLSIFPHNRLSLLYAPKLRTSQYVNFKHLTLELPHNSKINVFVETALMLEKVADQLEELKIFGTGPDRFGVKTSSNIGTCGKIDAVTPAERLVAYGQECERRIFIINKIQFLSKLRVLVLDNLNLPLLPAQVLKNKPYLERAHIGADPRSMLHPAYFTRNNSFGLYNLVFPPKENPPVKELSIIANSALSAYSILAQVTKTLEILDWVIPDVSLQNSKMNLDFLLEAAQAIRKARLESRNLHTYRLCCHGAIYENCHQYGTFIGAFNDCIPNFPKLKTVEVHILSKSPWIAQEFIGALPTSIKRFYCSDTLIQNNVRELTKLIGKCSNTPVEWSFPDTYIVGVDLNRNDFIPFSANNLGFVGYEYDVASKNMLKQQEVDVMEFIKLNGRLLDKERNKHLAKHRGRYIPYPDVWDFDPAKASTSEAVQADLFVKDIGLKDDHDYFGAEHVAEQIFHAEPVTKVNERALATYPAVVDVEDPCKVSNHWLSK